MHVGTDTGSDRSDRPSDASGDFATDLGEWAPASGPLGALRDEYRAFVELYGQTALARAGGPEHVTASCFVLTPDLSRVLLCFHRKGRFWVQVGGHVEAGDASVREAALREAHEETGIDALTLLSPLPVDLDRHDLGGGFACERHWDVGYVATAHPDTVPVTSDESEDVRWFDVTALPANVPPRFADRITAALAGARAVLPRA